jgi:hypothetical protein
MRKIADSPDKYQSPIHAAAAEIVTGRTECYFTHRPLLLGQYTIYGGNAATPVVKDADVYVTLQEGMSCKRATKAWDVSKCDMPVVQPGFELEIVEVHFPIHDGQAPHDSERFKYLITWLRTQLNTGKKIHVGCIAGHGRTGTVLAALVAELGAEKDAIQYVRKHYCSKAVESEAQVNFLMKHYGVFSANTCYGSGIALIEDEGRRRNVSRYAPGSDSELRVYQQHLKRFQKNGNGYVALCPFHDDPTLRCELITRKGRGFGIAMSAQLAAPPLSCARSCKESNPLSVPHIAQMRAWIKLAIFSASR